MKKRKIFVEKTKRIVSGNFLIDYSLRHISVVVKTELFETVIPQLLSEWNLLL